MAAGRRAAPVAAAGAPAGGQAREGGAGKRQGAAAPLGQPLPASRPPSARGGRGGGGARGGPPRGRPAVAGRRRGRPRRKQPYSPPGAGTRCRRSDRPSSFPRPIKILRLPGYIGEFEIVDDHRGGKIVVELNGKLNKTGVIRRVNAAPALNWAISWHCLLFPALSSHSDAPSPLLKTALPPAAPATTSSTRRSRTGSAGCCRRASLA